MNNKTIGEICLNAETTALLKAGIPLDHLKTWGELVEDGATGPSESAAQAVAIRVLEIACPTSPILAAMKAGMTWEDAVEVTAQRAGAGLNAPEPDPTDGKGPAIWDLVIADINPNYAGLIADMRNRSVMGIAKYGKPLRAHNGRNPLVDGYQETLDRAVYLRQAVEESNDGVSFVDMYKRALDDAIETWGALDEERSKSAAEQTYKITKFEGGE